MSQIRETLHATFKQSTMCCAKQRTKVIWAMDGRCQLSLVLLRKTAGNNETALVEHTQLPFNQDGLRCVLHTLSRFKLWRRIRARTGQFGRVCLVESFSFNHRSCSPRLTRLPLHLYAVFPHCRKLCPHDFGKMLSSVPLSERSVSFLPQQIRFLEASALNLDSAAMNLACVAPPYNPWPLFWH